MQGFSYLTTEYAALVVLAGTSKETLNVPWNTRPQWGYRYHFNIHDHFLHTTLSEDLSDTGGNRLTCPEIHGD
jgi:4-alpha-glucanotransferase